LAQHVHGAFALSNRGKFTIVPPSEDPFGEQTTTDLEGAWWRGFYMVEKWSKDGQKPVALIYGGNRLAKAQATFDAIVTKRPRGHYTLRQRALRKWPNE
jgi:hypothetical protein